MSSPLNSDGPAGQLIGAHDLLSAPEDTGVPSTVEGSDAPLPIPEVSSPVLVPGSRAPKNTPAGRSLSAVGEGEELLKSRAEEQQMNAAADVHAVAAALDRLRVDDDKNPNNADGAERLSAGVNIISNSSNNSGDVEAVGDDATRMGSNQAEMESISIPGLLSGGAQLDPTLEALLTKHDEEFVPLEREYERERIALEKKYIALRDSYYSERSSLVNGGVGEALGGKDSNGIEQFWLTCLKNNPTLNTLVKDRDEECLKYLYNVCCVYPEKEPESNDGGGETDPSSDFDRFNLELFFRENPYFTNKVLVKKYFLKTLLMPVGQEPELVGCEGTDIDWKEGMDLTRRKQTKRVRKKQGGKQQTRTIVKYVDCDSFFRWFQTPVPLDEADDEEDYMKRCESIEVDFEIAQIIKNALIPNAVNWFTGDADDSDFDPEEYEQESEGDSEEDDSDEDVSRSDSNYVNPFAPRANTDAQQGPPGTDREECKTQ